VKTRKTRFLILIGIIGSCILFSACSSVTAKVDTALGELEFGKPFTAKYDYTNTCHLPFRWADGHDMTDEDLTYIINLRINLASADDWFEQKRSTPLGFGSGAWDWYLEFNGDCRETEIWLYLDGEKVTSLGEGKTNP